MAEEMRIVVPVLPGKSEAWRRFLQELEGSRAEAHARWCQRHCVKVNQLLLYDSLGGTFVLIDVQLNDPTAIVEKLSHLDSAFSHWLTAQIQMLHGLNVSQLLMKAKSEPALISSAPAVQSPEAFKLEEK